MSNLRVRHIEARRVGWLAVALAITAIGVAGCGDDDGGTAPASAQSGEAGEAILIKTHLKIPAGKVLPGSHIGRAAFCSGGKFRDEPGSSVGSQIKTIRCSQGSLKIAFSPIGDGSCTHQSGPWRIVSGSGAFEGLRGHGRMNVEFMRGTRGEGRETFTGTVTG
jgi:hypothetical protein